MPNGSDKTFGKQYEDYSSAIHGKVILPKLLIVYQVLLNMLLIVTSVTYIPARLCRMFRDVCCAALKGNMFLPT